MHENELVNLKQWLEVLRLEHRDLDGVIDNMAYERSQNQLLLRRMKKRKLVIKDQISQLESRLIPDLDA
ncbi:MAG: DUF465 domain-containing protein [Gammaproteobacteria bacterium]|nr:DUF465 domain-containing protein [Gammaproteobacteria bacterium]MCF6230924.1 DUF465 domain-containing protein [Gammaproteobacteria bacterium]